MSGDVFGNGMLLSRHIRLVAAFDHRHVFIDPNPDAATSFAERERLFKLPRSSWADYDTKLISDGGGVWARSEKSIPISPQARAALGIDGRAADADRAAQCDPEGAGRPALQRRHRHLREGQRPRRMPTSATAPTTRCASTAATCAARSSPKAATSASRSAAASRRRSPACGINTDAIDNSAGVDTSDHEVNIKILLGLRDRRRRDDREAAQRAAARR